jgi:aarF domain-containing kinase
VAVKVQRPDMIDSISLDLYILRSWGHVVEFVKSKTTAQRPYDVQLFDTFGKATYAELDYINEGKNQDFFAAAFKEKVPEVRVPAVFWEATSRRVLTSEWIEGKQLAQSPPEVITKLTTVGVKCFLVQLLELGAFHSDPHPGNMLVDETGR